MCLFWTKATPLSQRKCDKLSQLTAPSCCWYLPTISPLIKKNSSFEDTSHLLLPQATFHHSISLCLASKGSTLCWTRGSSSLLWYIFVLSWNGRNDQKWLNSERVFFFFAPKSYCSFYEPQNACCKLTVKTKQGEGLLVQWANVGVVDLALFSICLGGHKYWSYEVHILGHSQSTIATN